MLRTVVIIDPPHDAGIAVTAGSWARLRADVTGRLRRGAWYRVLRLGPQEAVLQVGRTAVSVSRSLLQFSYATPIRWSVVLDPRVVWGGGPASACYAVCPNCRRRVAFDESPSSMRCPGCNGLFEVAWDEGEAPRRTEARGREERRGAGELQPDRRTAQRRLLSSRRRPLDRRLADRRRASARVSRGRRRLAERRNELDRRTRPERRQLVKP